MSYSSQIVLLEATILRYQFLYPGVTLGQDLKTLFQSCIAMVECLSGMWPISKLIRSMGSGFPMGPNRTSPGLSSMAMVILSLTPYKSKVKFHKMGRKMQRNEQLRSRTMGMFEREAIDEDPCPN
jgi:hypothetical protein